MNVSSSDVSGLGISIDILVSKDGTEAVVEEEGPVCVGAVFEVWICLIDSTAINGVAM